MKKKGQNKYLAIPALALLLALLFHFIDPRKFLENLGYASLVVISLYELAEMAREKWSDADKSHATTYS